MNLRYTEIILGVLSSRRDERKYFKKIQFNRMWKWLLYYDFAWKVWRTSWDYFAHERRVMIENNFKKNVSENEHLKRWWYKIRFTFSLYLFPSLKFRIRIHETDMKLLNMKITWATEKKKEVSCQRTFFNCRTSKKDKRKYEVFHMYLIHRSEDF